MIWRFSLTTLAAVCAASSAFAQQPNNCTGVGFDSKQPLVVSAVTAKPRAHFVKSPWEDASCSADKDACQRKAYLVPGDLVLTGAVLGPFTCVAYQSPRDKKQIWTNGWMPTMALTPVAPLASPKLSDWTGTWAHTGGEITIERGKNGALTIEGEHIYPGAQNVQTGNIGAENVKPAGGIVAFAHGNESFENADDGICKVRMQRVREFLLIEDNGQCGGVAVSFTGLYRRKG